MTRLHPARRWEAAAATVVLALGLGGCGLLPGRSDASRPSDGTVAVAPSSPASSPGEATYYLEVDAPRDLRTLLNAYLDVARFQGTSQAERVTPAEMTRLANAAPAQARALLETEGYFEAQVVVVREESEDGLPLIRLQVEPGPRTLVTAVELAAAGPLDERLKADDLEAQVLMQSLREGWGLKAGEPFRQVGWNAAKNGALASLRAGGYPRATWSDTEARIDARARSARLSGRVDSGPRFVLGDLQIEGLSRYDESTVRNVSDLEPGTPYSEKRLLDFQERLVKLGLFETVSVDIDPDTDNPEATPVRVRVREQTLQQATTGFGYSDTTRFRVTVEHRHRRPFGWNGQVHNKLELGGTRRSWEGELISNPDAEGYRRLIGTSLSRENVNEEVVSANRVRVGRSFDTEHIERLMYVEWLTSELRRKSGAEEGTRAASVNYNWVWREVDSVMLPTKGMTAALQTGLGYARSNVASNGSFLRLHSRNVFYWPLGGNWYSQVRVEAGQVFANSQVGIPEPLLFRAGGDESVRGYGYRTLGPPLDNEVSSGRVLATASAEVAHPITQRIPSLWWAAFVDAGNAANVWGDLNPVAGYGLGLRYRSPVGPLRIDVAYGQEVKKFRLHLSVGIAY